MILLGASLYVNGGFNFPLLYVCCGRGYVNFFLGVLLAQIIELCDSNKKNYYAIALSVLLILLFILCYRLNCLGNLGLAVSFTICPAILTIFTLSKMITNMFKNRLISLLGSISFGIYLRHLPLVMGFYFIQDIFKLEVDYSNKYFFLATIIVIIIVSTLTYVFYEKPMTAWYKKIFNKYLEL